MSVKSSEPLDKVSLFVASAKVIHLPLVRSSEDIADTIRLPALQLALVGGG